MLIRKYNVKNQVLKNLIKYFWVVKTEEQDIHHKYLPVCNIDLVLNLGAPVKYLTSNSEILLNNKLYFNGITDSYKVNIQKGVLNMLGISFQPTGLYPFLKIPLAEFKNETVELDQAHRQLNLEITDKIRDLNNIEYSLDILEEILLKFLDYKMILNNTSTCLFTAFNNSIDDVTIEKFSSQYGINKKNLERFCNKYIGTSPKKYLKIKRFRNVIWQLENKKYNTLTDLACENNYFDQMHFIKDFKSFAGATPSDYLLQKSSLRDIITLV